jgi:NADH:ubiquinone oxidoreductase subunit H
MKLLEQLTSLFNGISVQKVSFMILSLHRYTDSKLREISAFLLQIYNDYSGIFTTGSVIIAIKFLLSIALLIFIRGGLPRYRFDHLTKVG